MAKKNPKIIVPAAGKKERTPSKVAGPKLIEDIDTSVDASRTEARQIGQNTETLDEMGNGFQKTKTDAEMVRERWEERNRKEGTKVYHCPFCTAAERDGFAEKKDCAKHIKEEHAAKVKQFKAAEMPEHTYTPKEVIISPKRRLEDFVPPGNADKLRRFTVPENGVQATDVIIRGTTQSNALRPGQLIAMTQSQAIANLHRLPDNQLEELMMMAGAHTKLDLKKAIRERIEKLAAREPKIPAGKMKPSKRLIVDTSNSRR